MKYKTKEEAVIKKYSNAKEIYALLRSRKMSKKECLFDWLVALFSPVAGIVEEADAVADLGTYFLVIRENKKLLVRVGRREITEKDITNSCKDFQGKKFVVEKNQFKKVRKVYG